MDGADIKRWREAHGLKLRELAELLPTTLQTLSAWEYGRQKPPRFLVRALRDLDREMEAQPHAAPNP